MSVNPADTRTVFRMRGGTKPGEKIRHTVQVYHHGRVVFEGARDAAERVFEQLRFGPASATEVYSYVEGI